MNDVPDSRRPLTSRDTNWAKKCASFLASINVSPNTISVVSVFFALLAFGAFYLAKIAFLLSYWNWMLIAIVGIQGRLVMNLLDGMVAVEHERKSPTGGIFNDLPDRIADAIIIYGAGILVFDSPYGKEITFVAIILAVLTAYIRTLGASLSCKHYFLGPMAKPHRMALLTLGCIVSIFYTPTFYYLLLLMNIGLVITCVRRVIAIANELNSKEK